MTRFYLAAALSLVAGGAQSQSICSGILSYAARDEVRENVETATAQSIYSEHCEGSSSKKANRTDVGIEAVVKQIPLKFNVGVGSAQEKLNNFCKIASDQKIMNASVTLARSTVVRESLDAFNRCIELSNTTANFDPIIGSQNVTVSVRRGTQNVLISGIRYDESVLKCDVATAKDTVSADMRTRVEITTDAVLPISCTRVGVRQADSSILYPRAELAIHTDRASLVLPIAADRQFSAATANELREEMGGIRKELLATIGTVASRLDRTNLDCKTETLVTDRIRNTDGQAGGALEIRVPEPARSTHVVVGGSCEIVEWVQDRPAFGGGGVTADGQGWQCRAGDPPGLPRVYRMAASVKYCRIQVPK